MFDNIPIDYTHTLILLNNLFSLISSLKLFETRPSPLHVIIISHVASPVFTVFIVVAEKVTRLYMHLLKVGLLAL